MFLAPAAFFLIAYIRSVRGPEVAKTRRVLAAVVNCGAAAAILAYLLLVAKPGIVEDYSLVFNLLLVLLGPFSILLGAIAIFSKSRPGYALTIITVFSTWAFLACVAIQPARFLDVEPPSVPGPPPPPCSDLPGRFLDDTFPGTPAPPFFPFPCLNVKRIRLAPKVEAAKLVFQPQPVYPASAKAGRIQGIVRLDAVIDRDGTVQDLQVISGHPLLVKAALEAVPRWRYQPTLLNGAQVEVATEIDVNFALPQ
jgi:TonB family protein